MYKLINFAMDVFVYWCGCMGCLMLMWGCVCGVTVRHDFAACVSPPWLCPLQITHAIMEKEAAHKGGYERLQFGPSTQQKTKKYIKEYMKKCGPVYKRS